MTKNVRIKITSKSFNKIYLTEDTDEIELAESDAESGEEGALEMTSEGVLKSNGKRVTVSYDESVLTGMEGSRTEVGFNLDNPGLITMLRSGTVSTILVFEAGVRHICTYKTPYMPLEVCVSTNEVNNRLLEEGVLELDYVIEIRGAQAERTFFRFEISENKENP